ncbi:MAG: Asp-tRNA(Asn)/Glu-tRNA(Gln) amidotransferase subunit GatB [Coriobacteriia bacterium]|nr:Asp-tRNA(Asn)/Glu-tRNA(Gln) amidotransferase subunit GatB [Coriobacteriia bacterium]MCL2750409.1 Asp-tRNA(Asn)/Glu-tRNA(Gln) amidotransferase subunit GatB [Coriobacteriia bacterium]
MKDLLKVLQTWEAVIGLEVHTELTTLNTKMFCSCPVEFGAEPNTLICPVCLGLPGALPVPNKAAIESIILAGIATNCDIEQQTMFYRKNYFYPDISSNFQITQGPVAFCMRGWLDLNITEPAASEREYREGTTELPASYASSGYTTRINITRIHMEEDAGKLVHIGGTDGRITGADYSLVDYNRCSTPLIELVTEPDLRTPEEARLFLQSLRQIWLTLGISDCSMEEGSLRCDGNVSLRKRGAKELGTKTELKNMNSFKNLHDGLAYEICRQADVLESGGRVVQETRHWEPASKHTVSMRLKETADDYRYFPEPNLAPYDLSDEFVAEVRSRLPELPDEQRARFMEVYALSFIDASALASDRDVASFFDEGMAFAAAQAQELAKPFTNLLLNDVLASLNTSGHVLAETKLTPAHLVELAQLIAKDTLSSKQGKEVFAHMLKTGEAPAQIVEKEGMQQVSDTAALEQIALEILKEFPDKAAEYRSGKTGLLGFFVGKAMAATKGQGNPKLINETFIRLLDGE